jgi:hydroxyethylthiazole kinase-like uncharacterized protein yjeF
MKLLTSRWMKELDSRAIDEIGIPSIVLMENASRGAADVFARYFPEDQYRKAIILVGKGNNGGDGLATGRMLWQKGYDVEFILLSPPEKLKPDPKINFNIVKELNLAFRVVNSINEIKEILKAGCVHDTFLVDAIFGTGINQPVHEPFLSPLFALLNASGFKIAAIDIPSGLSDNFLPEEGDHLKADVTATFQCPKIAHIFPDGNSSCGKLEVVDIGIPKTLIENDSYYVRIISADEFGELFRERAIEAHKGNFGHCLNVSGSIEKPGAGILSSVAILKSGAGLCTIAVSAENRTVAVQSHPEIMILLYEKLDDIIQKMGEFNCVLMGPGLGNTKKTYEMTVEFIQYAGMPIVLDADSINIFEMGKEFLKVKRDFPIILTPHPGEFSRLTGFSIAKIRGNRIGLSRDCAMDYRVYLVLKGHHTVIATPDGKVYINETGNAGMATAGSGDVLAGLITGLIGQFYPAQSLEKILQAAVFVHGFAGDLAKEHTGEMGLMASDILEYIPSAFLYCDDFRTQFPFSG